VIDLHCHIVPGIDDGPQTMEDAVELGRAAARAGTETLVATPHIREDHPFELTSLAARVAEVQAALDGAGVNLRLLAAGEVAITRLDSLDDVQLRELCLGDGRCLLVESPYGRATDMFEHVLFDLQLRGFQPLLAHPERAPSFQSDPARLERLVDAGLLCSVTAGSMLGRFGSTVTRFTARLFRDGLVHNVASDAHDTVKRPPTLRAGFAELESDLRGIEEQADWFTRDAPAAILSGAPLPAAPPPPRRRGLFRGR
jgi:protein-tyrosine phosphatase